MIKATFKNIGPIDHAELELGDFTIIAGQNNTGKTYLVYTLYGFLSRIEEHIFRTLNAAENPIITKAIEYIAMQMKQDFRAEVNYTEYKNLHYDIIKIISSYFSSELIADVFSAPNHEFPKAIFNVASEADKEILNRTIELNFYDIKRKMFSAKKYFQNDKLIFEIYRSDHGEMSQHIIHRGIVLLFTEIIKSHFPKPFILSAERFGISLFYKELDFTKNKLIEELQRLPEKSKITDPQAFLEGSSARYTQPIKDNIDFIRNLVNIRRQKSGILLDKNHSVTKMVGGYYKITQDDEIRFISQTKEANKFDIPLHLASSSARGVSDLYFFLKYQAQPGQILMIDEPESHLSPSNQVLMARLLAFCVNSGLKVLITTHSDYLIKEINNLIILNQKFAKKDRFLNKYKKNYTKNDSLDPKKIRAYICENGTLKPCRTDKTGIDMPVFDEAINKINAVAGQLYIFTMPENTDDD